MQCLILAGGLGTRMKTVAGDMPKALLPVGTQTFVSWQLQWLKLMGVTDVVLAVGHGGNEIRDYIEGRQTEKTFPQVNYSFDGPALLGTGGAILKAEALLSKDFIVAYGDTFLFLNTRDLQASHAAAKKPLTFSIYKNKNKGDRSNVFWDGARVKYDKFHPTADMEYIDYGLSIVNKEFFLNYVTQRKSDTKAPGIFDFAEFLSATCEMNLVNPFVATEIFQEIGSPEGYKNFCEMMEGTHFDLKALAQSRSLL